MCRVCGPALASVLALDGQELDDAAKRPPKKFYSSPHYLGLITNNGYLIPF